jgi:hypothetical protein
MSKVLSPPLAIIGLPVGPALATNYHDYYPWAHTPTPAHTRPGYAWSGGILISVARIVPVVRAELGVRGLRASTTK